MFIFAAELGNDMYRLDIIKRDGARDMHFR